MDQQYIIIIVDTVMINILNSVAKVSYSSITKKYDCYSQIL